MNVRLLFMDHPINTKPSSNFSAKVPIKNKNMFIGTQSQSVSVGRRPQIKNIKNRSLGLMMYLQHMTI